MNTPIVLPVFDPVALSLGPLVIRWYALAYIFGLLGAWFFMKKLAIHAAASHTPFLKKPESLDDYVVWLACGVILGGRLGYVFFYNPSYYLSNPDEILAVWRGGMAFHGGLLGVICATIIFCRRHGISTFALLDLAAVTAPFGLMWGRIANFINGELWGRIADPAVVPWAMVFPMAGPEPRHPSQLYEAFFEGAVLFIIMMTFFFLCPKVRTRFGTLTGIGLVGYGTLRFCMEFFREPDDFLGLFWGSVSMGQILSLPMMGIGLLLVAWLWRPVVRTP